MPGPLLRGAGLLGLLWALAAGAAFAQEDSPPAAPAARVSSVPWLARGYRRATPHSTIDGMVQRTQAPAGDAAPPAPNAGNMPEANLEDLAAPRAEKDEEPTATEEKAEEAEPAAAETTLLMKFLGMEDSPVKIYGWLENSYTGNANGTPRNGFNFGVNPNDLANRWMGNQYYLIVENPLEQNDKINFGFRVDNLFGNDWQFNHMHGFADNAWGLNKFPGYDLAQVYAEVHLPWLTKGGVDVRGGRFYTTLGYEVVPAIGRPLLSVPYMFNYGQPFTHWGVLTTIHVNDRINWVNGLVNGYDRWVDTSYKWNYLGGWTWTSKNGKANFAQSYIWGPNQYPHFLPANTQIVLPGATLTPYLAGLRNINYGSNNRISFTNVFTYKWSDKLTQVIENDDSFENNIPGFGVGGTPSNEGWYSFGNWFLYSFNDKLTGVWRSEVFRDNGGARTGFSDNFYEMTLGAIYKPCSWLWIRPEIRYDWAQFTHPYNDGTRNSQLTIGGDLIILF
ncbi:MAG: outer membrane beta-barrel protein [Isosphaeraceae bacterium]|nr:outer membrane beta-barrel protein [Isosphaeraceae bacterium]